MNALENLKPSESELQREMSYGKKVLLWLQTYSKVTSSRSLKEKLD